MATYIRDPRSPYILVKFKGEDGRYKMRSTKKTTMADAKTVGDGWEKAAKKAREGELSHDTALRTLNDMLESTTGTRLRIQSTEKFLRRWLDGYERHQRTTWQRYRPVINGFLNFLPEARKRAPVGTVLKTEVEDFYESEQQAGKSLQTANYAVRVLRLAFNQAMREETALSNPALKVRLTKRPAERRVSLTREEIGKLLNVTKDTDWHGAILLAAFTGIRLSDMAALTWGSIDMDKHTLTFTPSKTKSTSTPDPIAVALHPQIVNWLKEQTRGISAAPLFPTLYSRKPGSNGGLSNAFARLLEKAGIPQILGVEKKGKGRQFKAKGFHSLRHSFVTLFASAEVSADVRKAMAGHTTDAIHDNYCHLATAEQHAALSKVPAIVAA